MIRMLRQILRTGMRTEALPPVKDGAVEVVGKALAQAVQRRFGRSLVVRHVDAGSCNGCELELHATNNCYYDIERFGIRFTASPRFADVLLVTGVVTTSMQPALLQTYEAMPAPKWVVAVGDCAAGCGLFPSNYAIAGAVGDVLPVDVIVRGCPPTPVDILHGLLAVVGEEA